MPQMGACTIRAILLLYIGIPLFQIHDAYMDVRK